jgi:hypothetical protein
MSIRGSVFLNLLTISVYGVSLTELKSIWDWYKRSSAILRSVELSFCTDVSGQPIGPIFKGEEDIFLDFLAIRNGIDVLSRNVATELPFTSVQNPRRTQISYIATEVWNQVLGVLYNIDLVLCTVFEIRTQNSWDRIGLRSGAKNEVNTCSFGPDR